MTDLRTNASVTIDPSTPFCARRYFEGLREAGVRPHATIYAGRKGYGHLLYDPQARTRARPWHAWALKQDPSQAQQNAYVDALLDRQQPPSSDEYALVLELGISDDEIDPDIVRVSR